MRQATNSTVLLRRLLSRSLNHVQETEKVPPNDDVLWSTRELERLYFISNSLALNLNLLSLDSRTFGRNSFLTCLEVYLLLICLIMNKVSLLCGWKRLQQSMLLLSWCVCVCVMQYVLWNFVRCFTCWAQKSSLEFDFKFWPLLFFV